MRRYSIETKIAACKDYYENGLDYRAIYEKFGIEAKRPASSILCEWITKYGLYGEAAFASINTHQRVYCIW